MSRLGGWLRLAALSVGIEAVALIACWWPLARIDAVIGELGGAVATEPRPAIGSLVPLAAEALPPFAIVLAASGLAWILSAMLGRRWFGAGARQDSRAARWSIAVVAAIVAAQLALALGVACSAPAVGRGEYAAIVVALPSAGAIAGALLAIAATLVPLGVAGFPRPPEGAMGQATSPSAFSRRIGAALPWVLAACGLALLALFVIAAVAARPIADDPRYYTLIRDHDLTGFIERHLLEETGRYSQAVLIWIVVRVFGTAAMQVTPILLALLLAAAVIAAIRTFARRPWGAWRLAIPAGLVIGMVGVLGVPSVPDAWLWLSSATVYLPGIPVWILAVVCLARAWGATGGRRVAWTLTAAVLAFVGQGFYEVVSAVGALIAIVAIVVAIHRRSIAAVLVAVVLALPTMLGLAVAVLAPSVSHRAGLGAGMDPLVGGFGAVFADFQLWHAVTPATWSLILALAGLTSIALRGASSRARLAAGLVGAGLLTIVPLVGGAAPFLGLGWAPIRTYAVSSIAFDGGAVLAIGAVLAALLAAFAPARPLRADAIATTASLVLAVVGVALAVPDGLRLIEAEQLRAGAFDERELSVAAQLAAGADPIEVMPAPLLYFPAEARDLEFRAVQPQDWFWPGFRWWHGIPDGVALAIVTEQPADYCVEDERVSNPVVRTCAELAGD